MSKTAAARAPAIAILIASAAFGLNDGFASGPPGEALSAAQYVAVRSTIQSDFRTARVGCEPMGDTVKDLCLADVARREALALAELKAAHEPGPRASYELRLARANVAFALQRERCDDQPASRREACLADARAAQSAALADPGAPLANPGSGVEAKRNPASQ